MATDLKKLQGTWLITALEVDGNKMGAGMFGESKIIVKGDRFTTISMGATYEGKVTVDEKKKPKAFELKFTVGPEKGNISFGIYELDGDTWKICLTVTGKTRPKRFATSPGSGLALETLKRSSADAIIPVKKGVPVSNDTISGKARAAITHFEPAPELEGEWQMTACVTSGQALRAEFLQHGKRIAKNNESTVSMAGRVMMQAKFTVDRSKNPKTIDYILKGGVLQYGIYDLEGKILKVCFSNPGEERPADFKSAPGDMRTYTEWRLIKK
jgi:uncharacterized protein (TIGR03067 family)